MGERATGRTHRYAVDLRWTGNAGAGTATYAGYRRDHAIAAAGKPGIAGSADPAFRGDPARWNPEELLVAALSACHQLSYLALCARAGVAVLAYADRAEGEMAEEGAGGRFTRVTLRPEAMIRAGDDESLALRLHHEAHEQCFVARSVNFPVTCEPSVRSET